MGSYRFWNPAFCWVLIATLGAIAIGYIGIGFGVIILVLLPIGAAIYDVKQSHKRKVLAPNKDHAQ
ncbi:MAG: hypothetical protein Q7T42_08705 [Methylotenera sp.]|uniref:hypothetical protein n=1 Tax=Methylotenera sp. TaxID=2051956 RepID=UPI002716C652|nr:hypothetical protein [Methylotenera sp.]MDO9394034.1 hypothetical protein [Methylotenera sp.]